VDEDLANEFDIGGGYFGEVKDLYVFTIKFPGRDGARRQAGRERT